MPGSLQPFLTSALLPAASHLQATGDITRLRELYLRSSRYLFTVGLPPFVLASVFAGDVITAWIGRPDPFAAAVLMLLAGGYLVNSSSNAMAFVCQGIGRPDIQARQSALQLVANILLSVVLLWWIGPLGAPLGTSLALLIGAVFFAVRFHPGDRHHHRRASPARCVGPCRCSRCRRRGGMDRLVWNGGRWPRRGAFQTPGGKRRLRGGLSGPVPRRRCGGQAGSAKPGIGDTPAAPRSDRVIRVAIVASFRRPCGIGDVAERLARALPAGCRSTLIDLPERDHPDEWRQTGRRCQGHEAVHIHYEYGLFHVVKPLRNRLAALLGRINAPTVVTLHDALPRLEPRWPHWRTLGDGVRDLAYLPFFSWWEAAQYRRADHWIAHTREVYARAAAAIPAHRLSLLPLPVPPVTRSWQWSPSDPPKIVTPGFIKRHKGYEILVEVLERLSGWTWVVAGGPQDESDRLFVIELKKSIEDAGLSDRVRFTGYCSEADVEAELARATLAVLPFHRAAASSSLAWAIACGTPVIAADLPGVPRGRRLRRRYRVGRRPRC